ncbi:MAG: hypothetical protein AAFN91_10255 [Pseudomonadota bacterium]
MTERTSSFNKNDPKGQKLHQGADKIRDVLTEMTGGNSQDDLFLQADFLSLIRGDVLNDVVKGNHGPSKHVGAIGKAKERQAQSKPAKAQQSPPSKSGRDR